MKFGKKERTTAIIAVGLITAGAIAYFFIRKKGGTAIFYVSDDDLNAAQIAKDAIPKSILIKGEKIEVGDTSADIERKAANALSTLKDYDLTISIGGQITNPIYNSAWQAGLVWPLFGPGDIVVERVMIEGNDIILAAGFDAIDTVNAVYEAIAMIQ